MAGNIHLGSIDIPPVPTPPSGLTFSPATPIEESETITAGQNTDRCQLDSSTTPPITHCLVSEIDLKGGGSKGKNQKKLTVDTTNGPVRIYVAGDVNFSGGAAINHIPGDQPSTYLGLFGNPPDGNDGNDQSVDIAGASTSR